MQLENILNKEREQSFDSAVSLAALICETPISLISFVEGEQLWFKARVGLDFDAAPLNSSFCRNTLQADSLYVVQDVLLDERVQHLLPVAATLGLRFYAGLALRDSAGEPVGTICVADCVPRVLTGAQELALRTLAHSVQNDFRLLEGARRLELALAEAARLEQEARAAARLLEGFMDNSPLVTYLKDEQGRLLAYNRLFAERFQISRDQWLGKDDFELWPPEFAQGFRQADLEVLQKDSLHVVEETSPQPNGPDVHWRSYKFPFTDAVGRRLLAGMSLDITAEKRAELVLRQHNGELSQANLRLQELSVKDALTGLLNRRAFDERLVAELETAARNQRPFSMLMIDVDHFKKLNDTHGHQRGDYVLQQLAKLLQQQARSADIVCRYGGEEFCILLPDTDAPGACQLAERIRAAVQAIPLAGITVSIGTGSLSDTDGEARPYTLARLADLALYQAKAAGRNRVVQYGQMKKGSGPSGANARAA